MAGVYTRRLGAAHITAANVFVLIYKNQGVDVVIRDIVVVNFNSSGTANLQLAIHTVTRDIWRPLYWWPTLPLGGARVDLRQELRPGESLEAAADVANLHVWVTGYVFQ